MAFGSTGSNSRPAAHVKAVQIALKTPDWLHGDRWQQLLRAPGPGDVADRPSPDARESIRTAVRTLRILARIPGGPWRATCLYRCVAAVLVLRRAGVPAVLRLGAAAEAAVKAHAWVEGPDGTLLYENRDGFRVLE